MASWEGPQKGNFRTAVIIESLGQFTLYIDSDAIAVNLDSFETAVERANSFAASGGSNRMIKIAAGLVAVAVIGGAAVGVMNFMSDSSGVAIAAVTEPAKEVVTTTYKAPTPVKTIVAPKPAPKVVYTKPRVPASTGSIKVETAKSSNDTATSNDETVTVTKPSQITTGTRVYSASNPALNGRTRVPLYGDTFTEENEVASLPNAVVETDNDPVEIAPLPKKNPLWNDSEAVSAPAEPKQSEVAIAKPEAEPKTEVANEEEEGFPVARSADDLIKDFMIKRTGKSTVKKKKVADPYAGELTASQLKKAQAAKAAKIKAAKIKAAKIRAAKLRAAKKRAALRRAHRRPRRVMRCFHGGCRWVSSGGYYDRQYRRHF